MKLIKCIKPRSRAVFTSEEVRSHVHQYLSRSIDWIPSGSKEIDPFNPFKEQKAKLDEFLSEHSGRRR